VISYVNPLSSQTDNICAPSRFTDIRFDCQEKIRFGSRNELLHKHFAQIGFRIVGLIYKSAREILAESRKMERKQSLG